MSSQVTDADSRIPDSRAGARSSIVAQRILRERGFAAARARDLDGGVGVPQTNGQHLHA